ncbi:MAG: hypothetical protein RL208_42 [Pseudomonadota bacterium]|jgi:hypothetical protein
MSDEVKSADSKSDSWYKIWEDITKAKGFGANFVAIFVIYNWRAFFVVLFRSKEESVFDVIDNFAFYLHNHLINQSLLQKSYCLGCWSYFWSIALNIGVCVFLVYARGVILIILRMGYKKITDKEEELLTQEEYAKKIKDLESEYNTDINLKKTEIDNLNKKIAEKVGKIKEYELDSKQYDIIDRFIEGQFIENSNTQNDKDIIKTIKEFIEKIDKDIEQFNKKTLEDRQDVAHRLELIKQYNIHCNNKLTDATVEHYRNNKHTINKDFLSLFVVDDLHQIMTTAEFNYEKPKEAFYSKKYYILKDIIAYYKGGRVMYSNIGVEATKLINLILKLFPENTP